MFWLGNNMDMSSETAAAAVMTIVQEVAADNGYYAVLSSNQRRRGEVGSSKSYHEFGYAWDFLFSHAGSVVYSSPVSDRRGNEIREELTQRFGRHMDVVWHNAGSGLHIHIEWDPEPRRDDDPLVGT